MSTATYVHDLSERLAVSKIAFDWIQVPHSLRSLYCVIHKRGFNTPVLFFYASTGTWVPFPCVVYMSGTIYDGIVGVMAVVAV